MKQACQILTSSQLQEFAPLGKLSDEDAQELLGTSIVVQLSPGTTVFTQDDSDKQLFYLIEGAIELRSLDGITVIKAKSKEAKKPLGRHLPGQESAVVLETSTLISFDTDMLDLFLTWTNPNAYVVSEMETNHKLEWLTRMMKSHGLLKFSEQQISILLGRMNEVHFNKGDVVVLQDDDNDYFYVIKEGRAMVTRKPSPDGKEIKLAELSDGDAFGEEAILANAPRGATVTMQEAGNLMRLSKQDFSELLAEPMLETVSWQEAQALSALGATFLDIRQEEEFKEFHILGSINTPLPLLRLKLNSLKQRKKYIVYCDDGSRSSVAAYLLNQQGFEAYILDGGISTALPHLAEQELESFAVDETLVAEDCKDQEPTVDEYNSVEQPPERSNEFRSMADYWGATVDMITDDDFDDSDSLHKIEKSKLTPASEKSKLKKPVSNKDFVLSETSQSRTKQQPYTLPRKSHTARNIMITLGAIGIIATYAMLANTPEETVATPETSVATIQETNNLTEEIRQPNKKIVTPVPVITPKSVIQPPVSSPDISQPVQPSVENQAPPANDMALMDQAVESGINISDEEIMNLEPTGITPAPKKESMDPATRGFLE